METGKTDKEQPLMSNYFKSSAPPDGRHHIVIIGGGFAGLYAAKSLRKTNARVTLIDRRNFHLFQPLLYQVATGELSPGDIASPLRAILKRQKNTYIMKADVTDIDPQNREITADGEKIPYDTLIIATGSKHHYFGHSEWEKSAPGLKTVEDALEMRRRIFNSFEKAEQETDPDRRRSLLTFLVVGGGPTGVELAGALGELALKTMRDDFRTFSTKDISVLLVEGSDQILQTYPKKLSSKALKTLSGLGVSIRTGCMVTGINGDTITIKEGENEEKLRASTVLWAAGVTSSPLGRKIAEKTGAETDRSGRVKVDEYFSVPDFPNLFVIGDLAHYDDADGGPLPGLAPVAMQEGRYVAHLVTKRLQGEKYDKFRFINKGSLAVIGRNAAIADFGWLKLSGFPAWIIWVFVHIGYLIEFDNKLLVMIQWGWNYFTRKRGARLITKAN